MADKGQVLNMIWANEAGVSVYVYEGEHERRVVEIHGVVNDYEAVLATATIEKHNRDRFAESMRLEAVPVDAQKRDLIEVLRSSIHAMRSYQHGNISPDLADEVEKFANDLIRHCEEG